MFASSEVAPFAKTGGLGAVSAALPRALAAARHDVRVVLPMYSRVHGPGGGDRAAQSTARDSGGEHKHGGAKLLLPAASSAELKVFVAESLYIRLTLAIIAVLSSKLEHSAYFANLANNKGVNHLMLIVQGH